MSGELVVSVLRVARATEADRSTGLLAYASLVVGGVLVLEDVAIRRTRDGRLTLAFPRRDGRRGRRRHLVRPASDAARRDLERQVLEALDIQGALP